MNNFRIAKIIIVFSTLSYLSVTFLRNYNSPENIEKRCMLKFEKDFKNNLEKRLRLAPSPTGLFHIGTARTALFNWLYARNIGGKFLIRIEDTDFLRSKSEYTKNILEGLKWLGLKWDEEPIKQSDRISNHKSYIKKL